MSTFPSSAPSPSISKSEYSSSLPWFRRWLAMLNWRPVVDYELREIEFNRREIEFEQSECEYEQRKIAHKQGMKQLRSEISQIERENERLAELSAILSNSAINSNPANPTLNESEM